MAIKKQLLGRTIVILTENFNPTIINRYWLVSNGIIDDSLILENSIFVPQFTQVVTSLFNIIALPHQIQLSTNDSTVDLAKYCFAIISKMEVTPFQAVGFNFDWTVEDDGMSIEEFSKKYFFISNSTIHESFDIQDARFGSFASKKFGKSILQLNIKPATLMDTSRDVMVFAFNFHVDLNCDKNMLLESLSDYSKFSSESNRIVDML